MRGRQWVVIAGAAAATLAGGFAMSSCGGDDGPVCGNKKVETGEQCDDGNADELDECRMCQSFVAGKTRVKWAFDQDAAPGFNSDGCVDVGSDSVRVDLSGPANATQTGVCSQRQVEFAGLAEGTYTAAVTPLDPSGASLVTAPPTLSIEANTVPNTVKEYTIVVPPEAWARPMTGTFYFLLRWAGMECASAAPPVVTQLVTMRQHGTPLTASTGSTPMYRLDGTQPVGCVNATTAMAEFVLALPFGRATVDVSGKDQGGNEMFRGTFDTFVGAGVANPVMTFDVQSTIDAPPPDAPTDAPDDAPTDAPTDAAPDA